MSDGRSELGMAFAFVAGAAVGAGLALLLAPRTGDETRAQLNDWLKQAQEKLREMSGKQAAEPTTPADADSEAQPADA